MKQKVSKSEFLGDFIEGNFQKSTSPDGEWNIISPADADDPIIDVNFDLSHIDKACAAAARASRSWKRESLDKRKEYLMRLHEVYKNKQDEIATMISRETGKPFWEAQSEAKAMAGKILITIEHSLQLASESCVENALPGVNGFIRYKPRGVMAVIGPFNFPGHLPNGHIVPALLTGNTIVFKPSDKTPGVGQLMAQMFQEAEFPEGVFNLIHGSAETGKRLVNHESVDGVLFTGSYEVGLKIKQSTVQDYWKLLALEMGGKNTAIVWEDADLEKAVYENLIGSFLSTGQRCSCTSRIVLHPKIKDIFLEKFVEATKALQVGHWESNPFMGPLIDVNSMERYLTFQGIARRDSTECLLEGESLNLSHKGNYVSPSIYFVNDFNKDSVYQNTEIFGPNVAVYETDNFDKALEITNASGYGLVMSIFSKNRKMYEEAFFGAKVGLVNWNRTTNGASSRLPFGGMGKSGNDRPSGHFAVQYCTVPVSSLEDETPLDTTKLLPGVSWISS